MERADNRPPIPTHPIQVEIGESIPPEVYAGTDIALKVKVTCPRGCDLRGTQVKVMAPDAVVMTSELATYENNINETQGDNFKAPREVGEFAWSVVFPRHETESVVHEECCLPIAFRTKPHPTSMAVWDVPSPVVMNSSFKVKVGIKCSALCQLTGSLVEIHDEAGATIGHGRLGEGHWPGTDSLHWAEVELVAPATEGVAFLTVTFAAEESALPHEDTSTIFSVRAAKPPEHKVTIKIIAKETGLPVDDVEVRLGQYEAFTDLCGLATLDVPKSTYCLTIRKDGYDAEPIMVDVTEDAMIHVEASKAPTKAEIEERMMRYEDYPWG